MINPKQQRIFERHLAHVPGSHILKASEYKKVVSCLHYKKIAKGQNLVDQHDDRNYTFILKKGFLKIRSFDAKEDASYVSFLSPNMLFPLRGMFVDSRYCYTVTALTNAEVIFIPTKTFEGLLKSNHKFSLMIIKKMQEVVSEEEIFIQRALTPSATKRVEQVLKYLNNHHGIELEGGRQIPFPLTIKENATIAGTTRETAGQVIHELVDETELEYSRKYLFFPEIYTEEA